MPPIRWWRGLPKEELRAKLRCGRRGPRSAIAPSVTALLNALLQFLARRAKSTCKARWFAWAAVPFNFPPREVAARDQIAAAFEKAGLAVPSAREVLANLRLDRARAEKLLRMLVKENVLHEVTEDLIFHQSALRAASRDSGAPQSTEQPPESDGL